MAVTKGSGCMDATDCIHDESGLIDLDRFATVGRLDKQAIG
jgi:hypothetical protein